MVQSKLRVIPLTLKQANDFVGTVHRHHKPVTGHRFSVGAIDDSAKLVGVAIVGRPVARAIDQNMVAEVTRLATDGTDNACSALYGACARAAKAMGFEWIQTYILEEEPGTSLKAAGWECMGTTAGRSWNVPSRARKDAHPLGGKSKWGRYLNEHIEEVDFGEVETVNQETQKSFL